MVQDSNYKNKSELAYLEGAISVVDTCLGQWDCCSRLALSAFVGKGKENSLKKIRSMDVKYL
mgnify:CR=1 FL=1